MPRRAADRPRRRRRRWRREGRTPSEAGARRRGVRLHRRARGDGRESSRGGAKRIVATGESRGGASSRAASSRRRRRGRRGDGRARPRSEVRVRGGVAGGGGGGGGGGNRRGRTGVVGRHGDQDDAEGYAPEIERTRERSSRVVSKQ